MPHSFFARAVLILLFPVVVLQLVVGFVFIQRHYEQITTQMAGSVALELNYAAHLADSAREIASAHIALATIGRPFNMRFNLLPDEVIIPDARYYFYDLSGKALVSSLQRDIERAISVNLTKDFRAAEIRIQTDKGVLLAIFPRSRVSASNPHQLLVLMVAVSIILTVISALFLRNQVRPIRKLAQASEAFGKGRIEHYRPAGATEIRRAGYSFLAMRARLERQIEQRTQMLSGVSHDLRTPLTRMRLSLALMDETTEIAHLRQDVTDMEKMLGVFLTFARGDALEETLSTDPVAIVEKIANDARRTGNNVQVNTLNNGPKNTHVTLRPLAVSRAITNLVSNACHYGSEVVITVMLSLQNLDISVEDNGPGIAKSDRNEALKPFVRLDLSRNQNDSGGVGLGLSISADVARSHGGTLILSKSKSMGGLRARFSIPR
ncbi:MAG: ATP-binding protein [Paracoccaceae bacterium]